MISFIVPAYNEEKYLAPTLASIHAAARAVGEPFEVVVANDDSSDATARIAEEAGARVVTVHNRQIAATRNAGARASSGDVLVFVDADTRVDAPVIAEALAALRAGAVGGGAPVRLDPSPLWVRLFMMAFVPIYFGLAKWAAGCFVYCTREAFEKAGGFDESYFAGEEIFFSRALKRQGRFAILRTFVTSSARKLDSHSFAEVLWLCLKLVAGGSGSLKKRGSTAFWYPDKR